MSQENVDVVQAMLEAWNERRMDAFRNVHDPDVVIMRFIEGWPEPSSRGDQRLAWGAVARHPTPRRARADHGGAP
jgi:hypothetical protein